MIKRETLFYECGICDCIHRWDFDGDCRNDAERLNFDDIPTNAEVRTWDDRIRADLEVPESDDDE